MKSNYVVITTSFLTWKSRPTTASDVHIQLSTARIALDLFIALFLQRWRMLQKNPGSESGSGWNPKFN